MFCRDWTVVKDDGPRRTVAPLKCKRWTCPECAPERQKALRAQARAGHPDKFLTLTVNPAHFDSPVERARQLVRAWRCLRLRAMRRFKLKRLPFLAVFEATKRGEPHLHILLRCRPIPQAWISDQMADLIGAPIVDIRKVKNAGMAAAYVTKYLTKAPHHFASLKRYWASQDWTPRSEDDLDTAAAHGGTVEIWKEPIADVIWRLKAHGWLLAEQQDEAWIFYRWAPYTRDVKRASVFDR